MTRRKYSREFKIEAVKLVSERGVSVAQVCRDLDLAESVFRRWLREAAAAPTTAFPGNGRQRDDLADIAALKKEAGVELGHEVSPWQVSAGRVAPTPGEPKPRLPHLNEEVFNSLAEARAVIERWRVDFNTARPHSAHGGLTPAEARERAAADRLRPIKVSADRPLPARPAAAYENPGPAQ